MSEPGTGTQELIRDLAEDLTPVRRLPALRWVALGVVGLWALVAVPGTLLRGVRPDLVEMLLADRGASWIFWSLAASGLGGVVAALALSIPGRDWVATGGLAVGLLGLATAAGLGTLLVLSSPSPFAPLLAAGDLRCLGMACGVAAVPAVGVVWFLGRAAPYRPLLAVLAGAAGMAALGALAAQASCPYGDPRHLLAGHVLAPAVGALVLTAPLVRALRRWGRRSGS